MSPNRSTTFQRTILRRFAITRIRSRAPTSTTSGLRIQLLQLSQRRASRQASHRATFPTQAACGTCDKPMQWSPATGMDHSGFTSATNCASCHNGASATGKSGSHIPTTANCISCHSTRSWKPSSWNHSPNGGGETALDPASTAASHLRTALTALHIPCRQSLSGVSTANCDTCHRAGYASWNPVDFHANVSVSGQRATCHLSSGYGRTATSCNGAIHAGQSVRETLPQIHGFMDQLEARPRLVHLGHQLLYLPQRQRQSHRQTRGAYSYRRELLLSCHSTSAWRPDDMESTARFR